MTIRSRAESLRPVRFFRNRQRDRGPNPAGAPWRSEPDADTAGHDALAQWELSRAAAVPAASTDRIAIVGMGCRFPDADDPVGLLEVVMTGRKAFRRLPPSRLDLADYYSPDRSAPDATYSARAAVIKDWQFDLAQFGVPMEVYRVVDPAHWLALETAARALAAAGFVMGQGLPRARAGVMIGNSLTGDASRAAAMRLRWPYVRRVFADALAAGGIPAQQALPVLGHAKQKYLAPFPATTDETLAGSMPAAIAARICGYFGFRGGGYTVDGAQASSLLAVASACSALCAGDLDVALAGGVDLGLDPLELVGLAKTGVLARGDMRVYDENPTGYLPGEGCGLVVLMRSADARAAGLPVFAEIAGWGVSSGQPTAAVPDSRSQFLALHRAYQRARIAPGEVQLIEGHGSGTAASDTTELSALAELRSDVRHVAALGSVKANIGNTKAAGGVAGLIKTVLAMSAGYIPPATGFSRPHPLLRGGDAGLRLPRAPEPWPDGPRTAGVSAMGPGVDVHLVLRSEPVHGRHERRQRAVAGGPPGGAPASTPKMPAIGGTSRSTAFLLHAADRPAMASLLATIARVAPWLSDGELGDLACQLTRDAAEQGPVRVALVASSQDHLARLASQAVSLLPGLLDGLLRIRPGLYAADGADGRATLLLSDPGPAAGPAGDVLLQPLSALHWLERLGAGATAAAGTGYGEIAGLVWAGCLPEEQAISFAAARAAILGAGPAAAGPGTAAPDAAEQIREAAEALSVVAPRSRYFSAATGQTVRTAADAAAVLCAVSVQPADLEAALRDGAVGASLLLESGPGRNLAKQAAGLCQVPAVSMGSGGGADAAHAAAALFAAGALSRPDAVYAGRPWRPVDIWREHTFITSPCQPIPAAPRRTPGPIRRKPQRQVEPAQPQAEPGSTGGRTPADVPGAPAAAGADLTVSARIPAPRDSGPVSGPSGGIRAARGGPAPATPHQAQPLPSRAPRPRTGPEGAAPAPGGTTQPAPAAPDPAHQPVPPGPQPPAAVPPARPHREPARHAAPAPAGPREPAPPARPSREPAPPGPAQPEPAQPGSAQPEPAAPAREPFALAAMAPAGGTGPWLRCYTQQLGPAHVPTAGAADRDDQPWQVRAATTKSFGVVVRKLFRDDPAAGRVLAVVGDPADPDSAATALAAAHDAISSGTLVLITHGPGYTGFCAALQAEHPELGVTVLRVPRSSAGLRAARKFAAAVPGRFREIVIDKAGSARESVMAPVQVTGSGEFPLGTSDVVLISRCTPAAGLALAQVLGCCGAAVAVLGQHDASGLRQLRSAGIRVATHDADLASPGSISAALAKIESDLGPVTVLAHELATMDPRPVAGLTGDELREHIAAESGCLATLADAIRADAPQRLRLILTFGSVAAHYPVPGAGPLALASGSLAAAAEHLAKGIPQCRARHIDWPAWTGELASDSTLAGELSTAGVAPVPVTEGSRLLLKALATPGLPARITVHGRVGVPAPHAVTAAAASRPRGRFLEQIRVNYPGVELVSDARLSLQTDPYLADHRVYGMPVLPAPIALEALAQAAQALAGKPLRQLTEVAMNAPVVVPDHDTAASTLIRVCALAEGDLVTAVLRCAESGFSTDHVSATFRLADDPAGAAAPALPAAIAEPDDLPASHSPTVDGTELYGPVCFQAGRFRRAALLPEVTARSCRALVSGGPDGRPWFTSPDGGDAPLLLGSPGLNDATWHVLQACVPHRRLLPAGCESVRFSGREATGAVQIRAAEARPRAAGAQAEGAADPARAQAAEYVWDVEAVDAAGQQLVAWRGLRLADAGPLRRTSPWPPSLLSVYLERSAVALGLDPRLRVTAHLNPAGTGDLTPDGTQPSGPLKSFSLSAGEPDGAVCAWAALDPGPAAGNGAAADGPAAGDGPAAEDATVDGDAAAPESGPGAAADGAAAAKTASAPDPRLDEVAAELRRRGEPPAGVSARLNAVAACLADPGSGAQRAADWSGAGAPGLTVSGDTGDGSWLVLRAGRAVLACTVAEISGAPCPVAIALMTADPDRDQDTAILTAAAAR